MNDFYDYETLSLDSDSDCENMNNQNELKHEEENYITRVT